MPRPLRSVAATLAQKIENWPTMTPRDCWVWTGTFTQTLHPLPILKVGRKLHTARRFIHEAIAGPVPSSFHIQVGCGNAKCVNPWHSNSPFTQGTLPDEDALPPEEAEAEALPEFSGAIDLDEIRELVESLPPAQRTVEAILALGLGFDAEAVRLAISSG